jgi:aminoglycoside phosphotransferase (APT) family kinase protein
VKLAPRTEEPLGLVKMIGVDKELESRARVVLARFGIGPEQRIAHAGESGVYELDDERVLRVPKTDLDYYLRRDELCAELSSFGLPFALPQLLDSGHVDDVPYTIEARIAGRSLDLMLPELDNERRERALGAYADAALALGTVPLERPWFGELLRNDTLRRPSWAEYLLARAEVQLARAEQHLRRRVPDLGRVWEAFGDGVSRLGDVGSGLAHGDYFPGNVMIDEDLAITGVLDFGFSTVIGDPRLDLVGASAFLEVDQPWSSPDDARVVYEHLLASSPSLSDVSQLYRLYYSIYFAFTHEFGLSLYDWCERVLREV